MALGAATSVPGAAANSSHTLKTRVKKRTLPRLPCLLSLLILPCQNFAAKPGQTKRSDERVRSRRSLTMMEDFLCGVEDLGRRMETLYDEHAPKAPSLPPLSSWFATEQNKSDKQPKQAKKPKRVNLASVNPSLRTVGLPVVERLMPRYLVKAGLACERMQHAGLPGPFIANVLEATFGAQTDAQLSEVFHYFDADGGGYLDEDEFIAIAPLLAEDVPGDSLAALMAAIDTDCNGTVRRDGIVGGAQP